MQIFRKEMNDTKAPEHSLFQGAFVSGKMGARIIREGEKYRYFDKNGIELHNEDVIVWDSGKEEKIYLSTEGELGIDATNHALIENGWAVPCEYGLYPLTEYDLKEISKKC